MLKAISTLKISASVLTVVMAEAEVTAQTKSEEEDSSSSSDNDQQGCVLIIFKAWLCDSNVADSEDDDKDVVKFNKDDLVGLCWFLHISAPPPLGGQPGSL